MSKRNKKRSRKTLGCHKGLSGQTEYKEVYSAMVSENES